MPERFNVKDDELQGFSLTSLWRTSFAQMDVYRDRPAPACAFLLLLATWFAAGYRMWHPEVASAQNAGACLLPDALFAPHPTEWRRYAFHLLWPLEPGYLRGFFTSTMLLLQGYTLEYEAGTAQFAALFFGLHLATAVLLLHFRFTVCLVSQEAALSGVLMYLHRANPKIYTDSLDKSLRVPFAVEPRWHLWLLQTGLLISAGDFPQALVVHGTGMALGAALALREPDAWLQAWHAARVRSFAIGAAAHVALLLLAVLYMPLTADAAPWLEPGAAASPSLLHMAFRGQVAAEAHWICRLLLSMAVPLLLSPLRLWTRFYSGACLLLAMYAMNSDSWRYPHTGFATLLYLAWAFWKLPGISSDKEHAA